MKRLLYLLAAIVAPPLMSQVMLPHRHAAAPAAVWIPPTNSTIVSNGYYNAFPGLAQFDDGKILIVYRQGTNHVGSHGDVYYVASSDGGYSFTAPTLLYHHVSNDARTGEVMKMTNGNMLVTFFTYDGSTEKGAYAIILTNGSPLAASSLITINSTNTFGCASKAVQLSATNLLVPLYGKNGANYCAATMNSYDDGVTWTNFAWLPTVASRDLTEPQAIKLPTGRTMMFVRDDGVGISAGAYAPLYQTYSDNDGTNWIAMQTCIDEWTPCKPAWINCANGSYYMVARGLRTNYSAFSWISYSSGAAWTDPVQYKPNTNECDYASLIRLANGNLGVAICLAPVTNITSINPASYTNAYLVYDEIRDPGFIGITPTNLPTQGANVSAWWVAADYATNAGVPTLTDRVNSYSLTNNSGVTTSYPTGNGTTLSFDGGDWLQGAAGGLTVAQPDEVDQIGQATGTGSFWFDGTGSTFRQALFEASPDTRYILYAGGAGGYYGAIVKSHDLMLSTVFSGTSSAVYTNCLAANVAATAVGTDALHGFTVGARYAHGDNRAMTFYELAIYPNKLTVQDRRALYWYWTNKYNIAP